MLSEAQRFKRPYCTITLTIVAQIATAAFRKIKYATTSTTSLTAAASASSV